jgi:glucose-1-phosphate adenylyltransferase
MPETNASPQTLTFVLAGGKGERLSPLTNKLAKPAVSFLGVYRIIDFTLSNCVNSGIDRAYVLTQYRRTSLHKYLASRYSDVAIMKPPVAPRRYRGTADAVYQNLALVKECRPEHVLVLSADHIYSMDYRPLLRLHRESGADATIVATEFPRRSGDRFGILRIDEDRRVLKFEEKPQHPTVIPGKPDTCLVNMGVYVFKTSALMRALLRDAIDPDSSHDFGKNILPGLIDTHVVCAHVVDSSPHDAPAYWRDVGTLDAYYDSQMELLTSNAPRAPYESDCWPIRSCCDGEARVLGNHGYVLGVLNALVCPRAAVRGFAVHSVVGPDVLIEPMAEVQDSVLMRGVRVGQGARLCRTIVEEDVQIPQNLEIGYDPAQDRRSFHVTPSGVVVVARGSRFPGNFGPRRPERTHVPKQVWDRIWPNISLKLSDRKP